MGLIWVLVMMGTLVLVGMYIGRSTKRKKKRA